MSDPRVCNQQGYPKERGEIVNALSMLPFRYLEKV